MKFCPIIGHRMENCHLHLCHLEMRLTIIRNDDSFFAALLSTHCPEPVVCRWWPGEEILLMSGQVWTRAASTGGQAIVKQSDSQWLSPLSKLTVAWACSQLVVTRSEPNDFFTLSRSLFIVIFKYLFRRCPVASLSCQIAFCIWSLVFSVQSPLLWVESAHLGFSRQPRCHTSKPLRLALVIMSWTPHKNVILACWAVAGEWNEATVNIPPDSLY